MFPQDEAHHHPVLPRLRDDCQVKSFNAAGQWQEREAAELERLSKGLEVARLEFEINSIPDMWARPLLFEMALYDPSDPEHAVPGHLMYATVLGEWRGLLALLALRELRGIDDLTAVRVQIPEPPKSRDEKSSGSLKERTQSRSFLETLSKLVPSKTLDSHTSWRDLYVFLFNGKPIGMTSPTTLVCTATDYYGRINNVPWFDGGILEDPTDKLSDREKRSLAGWLKKLKENLTKHTTVDREMDEWERLQAALESFIEDLGGAPESAIDLGASSLEMESGFFAHLNKAVRAEDGKAEKSHVRLVHSRHPEPATTILVVDERISGQWGIPPQDILVWGAVPLEAVTPYRSPSGQRNQLGKKMIPGIQIWKPEEFFTEKLFVIDQKDAFPGTLKSTILGAGTLVNQIGQAITPLLPIKKELIDHLTPDDLARIVSFEQSNGTIKVRLELPLSGPEGKGKDFVIAREYRFKDSEIQRIESVPVLEVWPNFRTRNGSWKAYYSYYSAVGVTSTFYAEPYHYGAPTPIPPALRPQTFEGNRGGIERRITRTTQFPEAMICEAQVPNEKTKKTEKYYAGLLLLEQPTEVMSQNKAFKVGVDFGASNTNVYAKDGLTEPMAVTFANRFLQVTDSGDRRAILYDDLLPGNPVLTPFLSLFHDFLQPVNPKQLRPLLDGHIFFLPSYNAFNVDRPGMRTDLKWSKDPGDRIRATVFLEQLCLQTSAEAVANGVDKITWAFSFPTAFPKQRREAFASTWAQVVQSCSTLTGLTTDDSEPESKTESVASARFFKKLLRANVASGAVCIDIGGSTSDIAVWHGDDLQWQSSIRFAGRDMFVDLLRAKPDFLTLFISDVSSLNRTKPNRTAFYAQTDALLADKSEEIFRLLSKYTEDAQFEDFTQLIAIGLAGLFYYVGSILQFLKGAGKYVGGMPDFYVGGNGSRLFHWLAAGQYKESSAINELFRDILVRASGFEDVSEFSVTISPHPKAEAAYGLICETKLGSEEAENADLGVVAGEVFIEAGQEQAWTEVLDDQRLKQGLQAPKELERLEDFIDAFNRHAASGDARVLPIKANGALIEAIKKRLAGALSDFRFSDDADAILVEPIFILALKGLLEIKTQQLYGE